MDGIKDDESTVEDEVVVETDRFTIARDCRGGLDAHDGIAGAVDLDDLVVPSTVLVLVVDDAVSGIGGGPEVPTVEEGLALLEDWRRLNLTPDGPARPAAAESLTFVTLSFQGEFAAGTSVLVG